MPVWVILAVAILATLAFCIACCIGKKCVCVVRRIFRKDDTDSHS